MELASPRRRPCSFPVMAPFGWLLPLLGMCVAVPAGAACRKSPWFDERGSRVTPPPTDLDGDGVVDPVEQSSGSWGVGDEITVHLSKESEPRTFSISRGGSSSGFLDYTPVPEGLSGRRQAALRKAVEDAVFEVICDGPEPSLEWLLEEQHALRWHPGRPKLPDYYVLYSEARGLRARAVDREDRRSKLPGAVWVSYSGHNHRRTGCRGGAGAACREEELSTFRVLQSQGDLRLLGTAHGVVLQDIPGKRHAWIWVTAGGVKLRFPTIASARFDGDHARIVVSLGQVETTSWVQVRLADGEVHTETCHMGHYNRTRTGCLPGKSYEERNGRR